jgi:hypothetical protein
VFLNSYFGRTLLPLGKPFGFIRKGPQGRPAKVVPVPSRVIVDDLVVKHA